MPSPASTRRLAAMAEHKQLFAAAGPAAGEQL